MVATNAPTPPNRIIGATTTYHGREHPYLVGLPVLIVGVLRHDGAYLTNNDDVAHHGGVTASDRIEVKPWIESENRFSFVTSDPRAVDLACFRDG